MPKCELCRHDIDLPAIQQRAGREMSFLAPRNGETRAEAICASAMAAVQADDPPGAADHPRWWICDACLAAHFERRPAGAVPEPALDLPEDAEPDACAEAPEYPEERDVLRLLGRVRRSMWRVNLLKGILLYVAIVVGFFSLAVGLEAAFGLPPAARRGLALSVAGVAAAGFLGLVAWRLFYRTTDEQAALVVERAFREIDSGLINAVRFAKDPRPASRELVAAAMRETLDRVGRVNPLGAVDRKPLARRAGVCMGLLLVSAGLGLVFRERALNAVERLARPQRNTQRIGAVKILDVRPGDRTGEHAMLSGDTLSVEVTAEKRGGTPPDGWIEYRENGAEARNLRLRMTEEGVYQGEVRDVKSPLRYRARVGDSVTRFFEVEVVEPPRIVRLDVDYTFPAYTGLPPAKEEDTDGSIRAVAGTSFVLGIQADRRLASARMTVGRELREIEMDVGSDGRTAAMPEALPIESDKTYILRILDERGHANRNPVQRYIRAVPDAPPTVRIVEPGRDRAVEPGGRLALVARANDDYGMARAELIARLRREGVDGEWERVHEWAEVPEGKRIVLSHEWIFDEESYRAGDALRYYIRVVDNNDATGPGAGKSSEYEVRIEDPETVKAERAKKYETWQERLLAILKDQADLRERTRELEAMTGSSAPPTSEEDEP